MFAVAETEAFGAEAPRATAAAAGAGTLHLGDFSKDAEALKAKTGVHSLLPGAFPLLSIVLTMRVRP
jgi:hypothetical protein